MLLGCAERQPPIAARVDDRVLPVPRLAELMVLAQPMPLTRDAAYELASHWVTLTAFAERMARGDSLLDSATVLDLMQNRVHQEIVARWRRRLLARVGGERSPQATQFDSAYARELLLVKRVELLSGAPALVRQIAEDPWHAWDPHLTLTRFAGGTIGADRVARQVQYLSPATRQEITQAPEDRIASFLLGLTLEEVLVRQADSAGVGLSDSLYRAVAAECRDAVHGLWNRTGLSPSVLSRSDQTSAAPEQTAARRVDEYLDAAAARRIALEPVPAWLAVPLLRGVHWEIRAEQMDAVLDRARRLLAGAAKPP